jgi:hypothetical protein
MKKILRNLGLTITMIIILITFYFAWVILKARYDTPGIIRNALQAPSVTLKGKDLSRWQLQTLLKIGSAEQ